MGAALVAQGDNVLLAEGYGTANLEHNAPNTPKTAFRIGSVSKQFTAAAILKLREQGLLDLDAPISTCLPDYPRGNTFTLHQVLTHRAGIPSYTGFENYETFKRQPATLAKNVRRFKFLPPEFEPGTQFRYSNSGYALLAYVVEHVSGQRYADFLSEHIFNPLGMNNSGEETPGRLIAGRASGYVWARGDFKPCDYIDTRLDTGAGSLYSSAEDLHKWQKALYRGEVLSEGSLEQMRRPSAKIGSDEDESFYGYGLATRSLQGRSLVGHSGGIEGFRTSALHRPDNDLHVVVLSNVEANGAPLIAQELALIASGQEVEPPTPRGAIAVAPDILARYASVYELTPDFKLTIRERNGRLFAQATGQRELALLASSETTFFPEEIDADISFILEEDGSVSQLVLLQHGQKRPMKKLT